MKNNIVFLIQTNYHLLIAISIILENFSDTDKFDITLLHSSKSDDLQSIDLTKINCHYKVLDTRFSSGGILPTQTLNEIKEIEKNHVDRLFIFNEDEFISVYLSIVLGRKGTIVGLCQDGLKAYAVINKSALKYRFTRTLELYKFAKVNRLKINSFYFVNIHYGTSRYVTELWLTHPEHSLLKSKKSQKINFFRNEQEIIIGKDALNFRFTDSKKDKVIFFISSIVKDNLKIFNVEKEILQNLQQKFPDTQIYLKIHPRTPKKIIDLLSGLENLNIIFDTNPAEFYLSELTNSIVLGSYSSALLRNVKHL